MISGTETHRYTVHLHLLPCGGTPSKSGTHYYYREAGRPGSSEVPRNPLTRWDVSSTSANKIFLTKKLKNKNPNGWRAIKSLVHKIRLRGRRGKGIAESSREKNQGTHRRKVDEKSCVTPAGTSNELDVQNEWEENTHTHTVSKLLYNKGW